jgi:hypothetical protein
MRPNVPVLDEVEPREQKYGCGGIQDRIERRE